MSAYALPALFALFVWWFSTGAIIYLDNLPRKTFKYSMIGASLVLLLCLWGIKDTSAETNIGAAYWAFFFGLFAWGWQEISFYMGFVTGPRTAPCPEGCSGWKHFGHAIQTSLWHELAIIASAVVVVMLTWGEPNQIGMWTFMVLWWMHQSAKLNVFLGVRNLNEEFLPEHLAFLKSFLKRKPMNLLFPVSITISTVITTILIQRAISANSVFIRTGEMFLGTMMALAILEHWFLVLPLPAGKLWQWGLASRKPAKAFDVEIVAGFLGAGKTTYMRRRLDQLAGQPGKTVVLVNDFSTVGIDGSLLRGQGADVVELPNGCICCSLRDDLSRQLEDTVARWAPDRVLIEPSGVADIASLIGVMQRPALVPFVRSLNVTTLIDAGAFLADFAALPSHFVAQAKLASLLVVNKTDLVSTSERAMVEETLRGINPEVNIVTARYGMVPEAVMALPAPVIPQHDHNTQDEHKGHKHHAHEHHDHEHHDHEHHDGEDALGFTSWSTPLEKPCDSDSLHDVLAAVVRGEFGAIARLKGLVRGRAGWIHFDVAGGRPSMNAYAAAADEQPRVVAIGRNLDETALAAAFAACALKLAA
jgi:putative photosynthetic complex assembly protein 2